MATFGLPDYGPDHDNSNDPQMKPISDVEKEAENLDFKEWQKTHVVRFSKEWDEVYRKRYIDLYRETKNSLIELEGLLQQRDSMIKYIEELHLKIFELSRKPC